MTWRCAVDLSQSQTPRVLCTRGDMYAVILSKAETDPQIIMQWIARKMQSVLGDVALV